jgi:hypothetical protein
MLAKPLDKRAKMFPPLSTRVPSQSKIASLFIGRVASPIA